MNNEIAYLEGWARDDTRGARRCGYVNSPLVLFCQTCERLTYNICKEFWIEPVGAMVVAALDMLDLKQQHAVVSFRPLKVQLLPLVVPRPCSMFHVRTQEFWGLAFGVWGYHLGIAMRSLHPGGIC